MACTSGEHQIPLDRAAFGCYSKKVWVFMCTKRSVKLVIYSLNTAQFMNESTPIKGRPFSLHCPNTCDHGGRNAQRSRGSTGLCRWLRALIDTSCSDAGLSQAWTGSLEFRHGKSYVVRQWKMYLNWATIKIYSLTQYIYAKQQLHKVATKTLTATVGPNHILIQGL